MKKLLTLLVTPLLMASLMTPAQASLLSTSSAAPTVGGFTSDSVEFVGHIPFESATSTGITIQGKYMYLTSWRNISVYDISDPVNPQLLDTAPIGFWFENEDVEVTPDGSYLFFSESLPGDALHVWNVEDKTNISEVATLEGAGDHTFSCILKCKWGYGSDGTIVDLRDPTKPKLAAARSSKQAWHTQTASGDGHDVTEVRNGFIIASQIDTGFRYMDVRNPMKPKLLAIGPEPKDVPWLFHSGSWPNGGQDRWVLMQGELNAKPRCNEAQNGPFMTYDSTGVDKTKTFKLTDTYAVSNGTYQDGSPAVNGLGCSAHWFEAHKSFDDGGLVAIGYYEHGTRFVDVASNGKIKEAGWFLPYAGSTSAAYWVPTDKQGRLVYAVDYTRGIDILRWSGKF